MMKLSKKIRLLFLLLFISYSIFVPIISDASLSSDDKPVGAHVAIIDMDMLILPGTQTYLEKSIAKAEESGAKILIVKLNTPGGVLQTTQKMVQAIFKSKVPVVIYVSPTGSTATSAGVFITLAGHIAAMAPGTSIGAAHPVTGEGKDIEGDMRKKAEEMTTALVKSIAEQRGRNVEWAEKAVRESVSLTDAEALKEGVIDVVAADISSLLSQIAGKEVMIEQEKIKLEDLSGLPQENYDIDLADEIMNVLANPNIAALLWLAATTGISIELYNPGLIFPGVVGVICLILALLVSQTIPISQGAVLLIVVGGLFLGAEFYLGTGLLGVGGLVAMVIGALYLIDISQAPGMAVDAEVIITFAVAVGVFLLFCIRALYQAKTQQALTGEESLVGREAEVLEPVSVSGKVFIDGEIWSARSDSGLLDKGDIVVVVDVLPGSILNVQALS